MTARYTLPRLSARNDPHRPTYHYLPPANWMNDPNGVIQFEGQYHLFYQHNPNAAFHADMHWGHAVSPDLIHWDDLPIALAPTPGSWDEGGIWSGSAVNNNGVPTVMYTGVHGERGAVQMQGIATSQDGLLTWEKYLDNPVIAEVPAAMRQTRDFRDPFVWKEADGWYVLLATRIEGVGGALLLYRSPDLIHWEYLHPLLTGEIETYGRTWECPNFFRLGDKWVLIFSAHMDPDRIANVYCFVGDYVDHKFIPEVEGRLDYGALYAPLTFQDERGRRLLWGWLREGRPVEAQVNAGWSGVQSIPRELKLLPGNRVGQAPVAELEHLRGAHQHVGATDLSGLSGARALGVQGRALDITAEFAPGASGLCGLGVLASPDGAEQTRILYDAEAQRLIVYRDHSSPGSDADAWAHAAPHRLDPGETLQLRILVDGSVIEVIANQRTSIVSRAYPTRVDSTGLTLIAHASAGQLLALDAWNMNAIWPS